MFILILDEVSLDILLDASGMVDREAFPNLHRFSRQSIWFREAISNYPTTTLAIPSLLSGSFAKEERFHDVSRIPGPNLLSVLAREGYRVNFYSLALECPQGRLNCVSLFTGRGLETLRRVVLSASGYYMPDALRFGLFPAVGVFPRPVEAKLLAELGRGEFAQKGEASLFHFEITHNPYVMSAEGKPVAFREYANSEFKPGVDVSRALRLYREQVQYADRQFGAFLEGLKASGAWERSVVVLTSDHGACWKPGCMQRYRPLSAVEPSLARVPMMIRSPALAPRILDHDYQHVDFFPTLLDILGIPLPGSWTGDGRSALGPALAERRRLFFVNGIKRFVELGLPPRRAEVAEH